ncbi:40S ribosomal protein S15-like [Budorcas taxicolor]|uniref:40S ribosomal protein S15-like n=1 Tax=Budorcas taxicolor TaxID=37181 RepID=UPI002284AA1F|nr:40S ribosomal protein S15-like [Budorcas taxicolor]
MDYQHFPITDKVAEVKQKKQTLHKSTYFRRGPRSVAAQVLQAADASVKCLAATMAELGLWRKQHPMAEVPAQGQNEAPPTEKPKVVMTHLWDMIILSKMAGGYNSKTFTQVEIKPGMTGHCAGRLSMTYQPVKHELLRHRRHPLLQLQPLQEACLANKGTDFSKN